MSNDVNDLLSNVFAVHLLATQKLTEICRKNNEN